MFPGITIFALLIQLTIFVGIIVFAVKLINRLQEISKSQESMAASQAKMVELLANENKVNQPPSN